MKAREGLRVSEGDLREVRGGLQIAQNELWATKEELQTARDDLQVVKEERQTARNEQRVVKEELQAARDELRNKAMLLDRACCEAFEAESSIERLTDECHAFRGDLQRQEVLLVQRDGAITSLRDEACTQWAAGWLAFQRRAANAYPGLDLNFDIPRDEEAEESFFSNCSREPVAPAEAHSPFSPSASDPAPDV